MFCFDKSFASNKCDAVSISSNALSSKLDEISAINDHAKICKLAASNFSIGVEKYKCLVLKAEKDCNVH